MELGQGGTWNNVHSLGQTHGDINNFNSNTFVDRSVYDVLPTPTNLHKWNLIDTPDCPLCGNRGTLYHILTACTIALSQGRYTWRHNQVLWELADVIAKQHKDARNQKKRPVHIFIVKTRKKRYHKTSGILVQAKDWTLEVHLDKKLKFPDIVPTNLRPGMVVWLIGTKKIIVLKLTVPWEERYS